MERNKKIILDFVKEQSKRKWSASVVGNVGIGKAPSNLKYQFLPERMNLPFRVVLIDEFLGFIGKFIDVVGIILYCLL